MHDDILGKLVTVRLVVGETYTFVGGTAIDFDDARGITLAGTHEEHGIGWRPVRDNVLDLRPEQIESAYLVGSGERIW